MRVQLCPTGKYAYVTAENAHARLREIRRKGEHRPGRPPRSVYHCGECSFYHLTSWTAWQVARLIEQGRWEVRNASYARRRRTR